MASMERPSLLSATACVLAGDTDTSRPGRSPTSVPGLADQKDTDRLMAIMPPRADNAPPLPSVCPICSMYADNGVITRAEVTATATYLDTAGHMWSVTWLEVA